MLRKNLSLLYVLALLIISAVAVITASASEGNGNTPCVPTQETPCSVQDHSDESGEEPHNGQERYGLRAKTADGQ